MSRALAVQGPENAEVHGSTEPLGVVRVEPGRGGEVVGLFRAAVPALPAPLSRRLRQNSDAKLPTAPHELLSLGASFRIVNG